MKVKNKLNTMATAPGLTYIFAPGETKEIDNPKELELIKKCPDIFEILEVLEQEAKREFRCEICGFLAKNQGALNLHKRKHGRKTTTN